MLVGRGSPAGRPPRDMAASSEEAAEPAEHDGTSGVRKSGSPERSSRAGPLSHGQCFFKSQEETLPSRPRGLESRPLGPPVISLINLRKAVRYSLPVRPGGKNLALIIQLRQCGDCIRTLSDAR